MAQPPDLPGAEPGRLQLGLRVLRDWRPTVPRFRALVRSTATSFVVLAATLWLLPGVDASGLMALLWLVALVTGVGALLRPLLLMLATALGGLGALLLGVLVQTIIMYVALHLNPATRVVGFEIAFAASWIALALAALVNWVIDAGTDDTFTVETMRLMSRVRRSHPRPADRDRDGMIIIQLDGVSAPLLRWAVRAGNLPNLGRWLRDGTHRLATFHTGVPATTPAMQAGILYGDARQVPAFRWYEKADRRLMVTNRPSDAAELERRLSTGRGLLRDGGVSIGNVFPGDAETCLLTVSRAALPGPSSAGYAAFMTFGLARAIVLGFGEIMKELWQSRQQRRRDVQPRIVRGGFYLLLRPATNVLLRDLNVSLIAEQLAKGAPVVYCDFVDYDEVAHHAGPARHEALHSLEGLDRVLGVLRRLAADAPRDYHLVVLSDHGQAQGATFRQRYGERVEDVVQRLVRPAGPARSSTAPVEQWGPVNALLTEAANRSGATAAATRAATRKRSDGGEVTLGPAGGERGGAEAEEPESVVVASGNLAMVYLPRLPGKATRERLDAAYPGLVAGLTTHPGVGVLVVGTDGGPVALGARGAHHLADGTVEGADPLLPYGPRARADLLRHQGMDHVGDLVLISPVDPATEDVAAYEELVGSHGGLGGWQTEAMVVHPAEWARDAEEFDGPDAVHRQLVAWLEKLGVRAPATDDEVTPMLPAAGAPSRPPA
ncbi:alkaline phosphatase family protein [Catenuloplanes atrovinosus]|uniref:Uncharacterized membrane protein YvlD (DUF360 family) n=1 Tax=Catenuloplanes atrovinosus TaxID=137266 RepID=A0AAE4C9M3_9ACTN|nr:alkaline phosphatase family protein [Catenuloplanes atrovinosus]MDR7273735.1 uncharacterized membrane protein YvlD (DUF360 family) [Catenuloplanes atrovinosus]